METKNNESMHVKQPPLSSIHDALTIGWVKLTAKDAAKPPRAIDWNKLAFFGSADMMMTIRS
jgi:hypothetical protein